jgi:hypothetical protein
VNTFTRLYGYAVVSRRSKFIKKGVKKTFRLIYDRGRKPLSNRLLSPSNRPLSPNPPVKKRKITTRTLEYPFKIALRLDL